MKRHMRFLLAFGLLAGLLILPLSSYLQTSNAADVTSEGGLQVITFLVPQGKIRVYLPDDMAAGDTISGSVSTESKGATDAERAQNRGVLNGYVVDLGDGNKVPADRPRFTWTPQIPQPSTPSRYVIKIVEVLGPNGKPVSSAKIPINTTVPTVPSSFTFPALGQSGRPMTITGPFDGDSSNTNCTVAGQPVAVIAESPRKAVIRAPADVTGPRQTQITDGPTPSTGQIRLLGVNLTSPNTNLLKGEKTTVTVNVSGLDGITSNVPLQVVTTGTANMQGGNNQNIQIQPNQVQSNGTYSQTFDLTGTQAGGFNVTGTVQASPAQNPCNLKDQTVHVESNYGGVGGVWVIEITYPDGTKGYIRIKSEKRPDLKYCNWIKVKDCHIGEDGFVYVDDYEKTENPNKKPPTKPAPAPDPPKPPAPEPPANRRR